MIREYLNFAIGGEDMLNVFGIISIIFLIISTVIIIMRRRER